MKERQRMWSQMSTAPTDGQWFWVLTAITHISTIAPSKASVDLHLIHRARSSPESDGYWITSLGNSMDESRVRRGLWAPLDALPVREMYAQFEEERSEMARRLGDPRVPEHMPLPIPFNAVH